MSGYCPAGKCECGNFLRGYRWRRDSCFDPEAPNGFIDISKYPQCPWPSRQVRVDVPDTENPDIAIFEQGKAAGLAEGIRLAREAVEKVSDKYPIVTLEDCAICVINECISAIDAVKGGVMESKFLPVGYRVERMEAQPSEISCDFPELAIDYDAWCIIRNSDSEVMSVYYSFREAYAALDEMNRRAGEKGEE